MNCRDRRGFCPSGVRNHASITLFGLLSCRLELVLNVMDAKQYKKPVLHSLHYCPPSQRNGEGSCYQRSTYTGLAVSSIQRAQSVLSPQLQRLFASHQSLAEASINWPLTSVGRLQGPYKNRPGGHNAFKGHTEGHPEPQHTTPGHVSSI